MSTEHIRAVTPDWWVPFETILCENARHVNKFLYLGIGPQRVGGPDVQLFLTIAPNRIVSYSWSQGEYMAKNYHDIRFCKSPLHRE